MLRTLSIAFVVMSARLIADTGMSLLPGGRPFQLTFTDPREIRMALSFEGDDKINAAVGNYFSFFSLEPTDGIGWKFHFGLEGAGYFTMRQADGRFPLETADGLIGSYFEGNNGPLQAQVRYTHVSAHLADGSSDTPIAYSRETLSLRAAYSWEHTALLYLGPSYLVNSSPELPGWSFQTGGYVFVPWVMPTLNPFVGTDLKWKQETPINPSWSIQVGVALNNPPVAYRSFRIYYLYYTGANPRGQYYQQPITSHSVGIEMQI